MKGRVNIIRDKINNFIFKSALISLFIIKFQQTYFDINVIDNITLFGSIVFFIITLFCCVLLITIFVDGMYLNKLADYKYKLKNRRNLIYFKLAYENLKNNNYDKVNVYNDILQKNNSRYSAAIIGYLSAIDKNIYDNMINKINEDINEDISF